MESGIKLRDVADSDLPVFFEYQLDPEANRMAAFTADDPSDKGAFAAHWKKIRANDRITIKTIMSNENVVGHIASFERDGTPEVTYWIGKPYWGRGIATQALSQFLKLDTTRPLFARAAKDNVASIRVLEKCGFAVRHYETAFANARGKDIEEAVLCLK